MQLPIVCSRSIFALAILTFAVATLSSASQAYAQTTWHVDDNAANDPGPGDPTVSDPNEDGSPAHPFDAIQEAIDSAADGDDVVVQDGVFKGEGNRDISFFGKAVVLRSAHGPTNCTIDCEHAGRGFGFVHGERSDSVIRGLTITNGDGDIDTPGTFLAGGAVCCFNNSSPTLDKCIIFGNTAGSAGGIFCDCSSPTITNCLIDGNESFEGGGIYCRDHSNPTVVNCTIIGNIANDHFMGGEGGAILCWDFSCPIFTNCLIHGNSSDDRGSVLYCGWYSKPTLINCTVSGNTCPSGSTIGCEPHCETVILNSIVWGNSNDDGSGESAQIDCDDLTIQYSCVQGWTGTLGGEGNFGDDPAFIDPDGPDNISGNEDDNLRLTINSPCIDAGDNGVVPTDSADLDGDGDTDERTPFDLDAYPRFVDDPDTPDHGIADPPDYMNVVDIGAYEFNGDMSSTGACCLPCACIVAAQSACLDAGGTFLGAGTDCVNDECPIIDPADFDADGDVDLDDFAVFQQRFAGPN